MRSAQKSIRQPHQVWEWADQRAREEGYSSVSAYISALVVYDRLCSRPHRLTGGVFRRSLDEQDRFFDWMAKKLADAPEPDGLSLFERLAREYSEES